MTRDQASAVLSRLRVRIIASDAHGILVQRAGTVARHPFADNTPFRHIDPGTPGGRYECEQWRIESGSGIAGAQSVWLRHMHTNKTMLGPYRTVREFTSAVRAWRRWDAP